MEELTLDINKNSFLHFLESRTLKAIVWDLISSDKVPTREFVKVFARGLSRIKPVKNSSSCLHAGWILTLGSSISPIVFIVINFNIAFIGAWVTLEKLEVITARIRNVRKVKWRWSVRITNSVAGISNCYSLAIFWWGKCHHQLIYMHWKCTVEDWQKIFH